MPCFALSITIHPPIQGGNICKIFGIPPTIDTPSHTGRKRYRIKDLFGRGRYTLPYREETLILVPLYHFSSIHPPIQGGNTQCLCGFQPRQTPRCANYTNSFFALLICHFFPILVNSYKKTLIDRIQKV